MAKRTIWIDANKASRLMITRGLASAVARILAVFLLVPTVPGTRAAEAGFRTPESLVRNVYAYYGDRSSALSSGLPRDAATARQFFDHTLHAAWSTSRGQPYDFLVQSPTWKLGAVSISILRRQFDKTYVAVAFDNNGRAVTLNFILVNEPEGWVISDIESQHDSLRMFLAQYKN
jgi:hypothetical protein